MSRSPCRYTLHFPSRTRTIVLSAHTNRPEVLHPVDVAIGLVAAIVWDPLRLVLEETEGFDKVVGVDSEAVIDASGDDEEVAGLNSNTDPFVGGGFYQKSGKVYERRRTHDVPRTSK